MGVVDDLVRDDDGARLVIRVDSSDGGDRHDVLHPLGLQRPHIGLVVDLVRRNGVAIAVPRHEHDFMILDLAKGQRAGRLAVRRADHLPMGDLQICQLGQSGAADNS